MIDLHALRDNPEHYRTGAVDNGYDPATVSELLEGDTELRAVVAEREPLTVVKNRIGEEIGRLAGRIKKADQDEQRQALQEQITALQ